MGARATAALLLALAAACGGGSRQAVDGGAEDSGANGAGSADAGSERAGTDAPASEDRRSDGYVAEPSGDGGRVIEILGGLPAGLYGGIWLIGWSGDLDHYTWFRFYPSGSLEGTWSSAPARCLTCDCTSYPCLPSSGGTFTFSLPDVVVLQPADGGAPVSYRFGEIVPLPLHSGLIPAGAGLISTVEVSASILHGYRFPSDHCGADLTTCPAIAWVDSP